MTTEILLYALSWESDLGRELQVFSTQKSRKEYLDELGPRRFDKPYTLDTLVLDPALEPATPLPTVNNPISVCRKCGDDFVLEAVGVVLNTGLISWRMPEHASDKSPRGCHGSHERIEVP